MTYVELLEIAKKRGTVQWNRSGIIEHLSVSKKGVVLARKLKQPKRHIISIGRQRMSLNFVPEKEMTFDCIELDPATKKPIITK